MSWTYSFSRRAQRQFEELPGNVQTEIVDALDKYLENPSASDVKKIKTAKPPYWRLRTGKWRIFMDKDKKQLRILVIEIVRRTDTTYS